MGQTLSSPITEKVHCVEGADSRVKYAGSSMQGWRISMEDAHTAVLDVNNSQENMPHVSFFGVYDGHGGSTVAHYVGKNLHETIVNTSEFKEKKYVEALKRGFLTTDLAIFEDANFKLDPSGCTACTMLIDENWNCIVANAGDSRAVLCRGGVAVPLSFDHKPYNPTELERITKAGGFVQMGRVNGNLALSRALGDQDFKKNSSLSQEEQAVTANPDIFEYPLTDEDEFIIIACDGIWDCLNNQEVIDFCRIKLAENRNLLATCNDLMHHCLADDVEIEGVGCDNMTVILIALIKGSTEVAWFEKIATDVQSKGIKIPRTHPVDEFERDEETESDSDHNEVYPTSIIGRRHSTNTYANDAGE